VWIVTVVSVDHDGMAAHLTRSDYEGSNVVDGTDDDMLLNDGEENRDMRSECEEDEGTTVKMETVILLVKVDRIWHVLCIEFMKSVVKYFFLADVLFLLGHLSLDKYIFPWQMCFCGGCLRLESSCMQ